MTKTGRRTESPWDSRRLQTLRGWSHVRANEVFTGGTGTGHMAGTWTSDREWFKELERENRELTCASEILPKAAFRSLTG